MPDIGDYFYLTDEQRKQWDQWVASRPPVIQELASRYPPGTKVELDGALYHVISYEEGGGIGITPIDPSIDYDDAVAQRQMVYPDCIFPAPS